MRTHAEFLKGFPMSSMDLAYRLLSVPGISKPPISIFQLHGSLCDTSPLPLVLNYVRISCPLKVDDDSTF